MDLLERKVAHITITSVQDEQPDTEILSEKPFRILYLPVELQVLIIKFAMGFIKVGKYRTQEYVDKHVRIKTSGALVTQPPLTHVSHCIRAESLKAFYRRTLSGSGEPAFFNPHFVLRWLEGIGSVNRSNIRRLYFQYWKDDTYDRYKYDPTLQVLAEVGGRKCLGSKLTQPSPGLIVRFARGIIEEQWIKEQRWPRPRYLSPPPKLDGEDPTETNNPGPHVCLLCLRGFPSANRMHTHTRDQHPIGEDGLPTMEDVASVPAGHKWQGLEAIWKAFEAGQET